MNKVQHFEIAAEDTDRASKFYGDVFGWKMSSMGAEMPYWMIQAAETDDNYMVQEKGAINGGMFKKEGDVRGPVIVISVDNTEEHLKKVVGAGGKTIMGPQQVGDFGIYAQFTDPEGNLMGLWQALKKE